MIRFVWYRDRKIQGHSRSMNNNEYNFCYHDYHNDQEDSHCREGVHCQQKTWTKRATQVIPYCYKIYDILFNVYFNIHT